MARKKASVKRFHFDDPIYLCRIFVCIGGDIETEMARFKRLLGCNFALKFTRRGCCLQPPETKDVGIWFSDKPGGGTAAHEAFHASFHILSKSGLKLCGKSEEAFAYHLDWIVREIGNKVW